MMTTFTKMRRKPIIAIDGPAASGKSTTARQVAARLDYLYIDTGAMYRALTLKAIRRDISTKDRERLIDLANCTEIDLRQADDGLHTFLDGEDVSVDIRLPDVSRNVSDVASVAGVRKRLVSLQQEMGKAGAVVMEGRDITTIVFPDAELKIFMEASVQARAKRRQLDLKIAGIVIDLAKLEAEISRRDEIDSTRAADPLRKTEDAVVVDTTNLSFDEQVEYIVSLHNLWL